MSAACIFVCRDFCQEWRCCASQWHRFACGTNILADRSVCGFPCVARKTAHKEVKYRYAARPELVEDEAQHTNNLGLFYSKAPRPARSGRTISAPVSLAAAAAA